MLRFTDMRNLENECIPNPDVTNPLTSSHG